MEQIIAKITEIALSIIDQLGDMVLLVTSDWRVWVALFAAISIVNFAKPWIVHKSHANRTSIIRLIGFFAGAAMSYVFFKSDPNTLAYCVTIGFATPSVWNVRKWVIGRFLKKSSNKMVRRVVSNDDEDVDEGHTVFGQFNPKKTDL